VDGHLERALTGVDVGGLVRVEVDLPVAVQEMGDALVAQVRRRLRGVDLLADAQLTPGEGGESRQDPRPDFSAAVAPLTRLVVAIAPR
jgi:hypothetical protein